MCLAAHGQVLDGTVARCPGCWRTTEPLRISRSGLATGGTLGGRREKGPVVEVLSLLV